MIDYTKSGPIHIVTLNNEQNLICSEWLTCMEKILDQIEGEALQAGISMVITGEGKFFSNGLNLEVISRMNPSQFPRFSARITDVHRRIITLPFPTVCAINGHAFAAGAFLALSTDYRVMREDRGWICISEVDAGVPLPEHMIEILRSRLSPRVVRDACLTGKRYTADDAIAADMADAKAPLEELLAQSLELARLLASKEPGIFNTIKQTVYSQLERTLAAHATI